ncbi:hypothetical protein Hanom_Chr12g01115681 [Helianthus anomalus]
MSHTLITSPKRPFFIFFFTFKKILIKTKIKKNIKLIDYLYVQKRLPVTEILMQVILQRGSSQRLRVNIGGSQPSQFTRGHTLIQNIMQLCNQMVQNRIP